MSQPLFPNAVITAAQAGEKSTGLRTCVTLAQWADETGFGKSVPPNSNNDFGIKSKPGQPYVTCYTWEVVNGKDVRVPANFAKYPTLADGFTAHAQLLTSSPGPYASALPYLSNWQEYIQHIAHTYATDPAYAQKLTELIEDYHLDAYNLTNPPPMASSPPPSSKPAP